MYSYLPRVLGEILSNKLITKAKLLIAICEEAEDIYPPHMVYQLKNMWWTESINDFEKQTISLITLTIHIPKFKASYWALLPSINMNFRIESVVAKSIDG